MSVKGLPWSFHFVNVPPFLFRDKSEDGNGPSDKMVDGGEPSVKIEDGDGPSDKMALSVGGQFALLMWKNGLLQSRKKVVTVLQIVMPTLGVLLFFGIRFMVSVTRYDSGVTWPSFGVDKLQNNYTRKVKLAYAPNVTAVDRIIARLQNDLGIKGVGKIGFDWNMNVTSHERPDIWHQSTTVFVYQFQANNTILWMKFSNFNGATVEFWEWISNFISHFTMDVITYLKTVYLLNSWIRPTHRVTAV